MVWFYKLWRWQIGVPALVLALLCLVFLRDPLGLQLIRHAVFDQFQRWQPRAAPATPVRIVAIDDDSLSRLGQWPWSREKMAQLTKRLQDSGAAVVGFDIIFSEPDRMRPALVARSLPLPAELRATLEQLPDPDQTFAEVLRQGPSVLGFGLDRSDGPASQAPLVPVRFVQMNSPVWPFVPQFTGNVQALTPLAAAAQGYGALSFLPDTDGVVRKVPLLVRQGQALLPSFVTEVLRVYDGAQNVITRTELGVGLEELRIGGISVATDSSGEVWIYYGVGDTERYIPAWKLFSQTQTLPELTGAIVLVGATAQGLMDQRMGALGTLMPGVEIHAQVIEQILSGSSVSRPAWSSGLELLEVVVFGLLLSAAVLQLGALPSAALCLGLLVGIWAAAWQAFLQRGWLLDPALPSLSLLFLLVVLGAARYVQTERRHRWIKQTFSRYVSPNLVNYLVAHPQDVQLSGRRQQCSFVFTDLEGFTTLMETMDPGTAVAIINRYLDGMLAIAFSHDGTIDRIVGDGLAIVFSAPVQQSDHAQRALSCAMKLQDFAKGFAAEQRAQGVAFGQTRMGVHTGEVIVGNFGGSQLLDYRALGDPINTASRLEGANRYLGTWVCISEAVLVACPDRPARPMRPIGKLILKGKQQALMVFEPLPKEAERAPQSGDAAYEAAYALLHHDASAARAAFETLASERPQDGLVAMHLARLQSGEEGDVIVLSGK